MSVGAAVVAATLVATAGTAVAQPRARTAATWGPVIDLAQSRSISRPDVVVDRAGNTTVVWRTLDAVIAIRQSAAGVWGDPKRLGRGTAPKVGVDGAGTVTAVWTRQLPGWGPQVMAARRVPGGQWAKPVAVSAPVASQGTSAHGAFGADLAVSHDGAVLVSWLWGADDSGASRVQARYRPAGQRWHAIATLSPVEARSPVCAIGNHGRAVVVYTVFARAFAVLRSPDGWTRRRQIGRHVEPPQVAMDDAGDVTAVWSALEADRVFRPQAVTRRVRGRWTAPHTLERSTGPQTFSWPTVAVTARGHSTAAWVRSNARVVTADHPVGGSWSSVRQVAPPSADPVEPALPNLDITAGRSGSMLLSWTRRQGTASHYIEAAYRPTGHGWQQPARVSPAGVDAAAAEAFVRAGDRAVAAWRGYDSNGAAHLQLRKLHP
ncbi:MAG: hypothetical protein ACXVF1_00035 [Nocardioidaceae bacterium]